MQKFLAKIQKTQTQFQRKFINRKNEFLLNKQEILVRILVRKHEIGNKWPRNFYEEIESHSKPFPKDSDLFFNGVICLLIDWLIDWLIMISLAITDKVLTSPSFKAHLAMSLARRALLGILSLITGFGEFVFCFR